MSDLISRQAAIDEVINLWADKPFGNPALVEIKDCIEALPSAQPESARINDCNGCKFIGCYDTDFPCANCVRKDKDYYEPEG